MIVQLLAQDTGDESDIMAGEEGHTAIVQCNLELEALVQMISYKYTNQYTVGCSDRGIRDSGVYNSCLQLVRVQNQRFCLGRPGLDGALKRQRMADDAARHLYGRLDDHAIDYGLGNVEHREGHRTGHEDSCVGKMHARAVPPPEAEDHVMGIPCTLR